MLWYERFENMKKIYEKLTDDESRYIFKRRCDYLIERDEIKLWNGIKNGKMWRCPNKEDNFVIFGAGAIGAYYLDILQRTGKNVKGFCDSYKTGCYLGKPILTIDDTVEWCKKDEGRVIVPSGRYRDEMIERLKQHGISSRCIVYEPDIRSYTGVQYFDVWEPRDNEILIDCGAYDGDTIRDFVKWCGYNYEMIYSFEPSKNNYEKCENYLLESKLENCKLIDKGTWKESDTLRFCNSLFDTGDHIITGGEVWHNDIVEIQVTSIDEVLEGRKATFIKMDVEGSEMESLIGARETITKHKPRLAIALYHKWEDIFDIPLYILSLNSNYTFKLRHYSSGQCETVLYAE